MVGVRIVMPVDSAFISIDAGKKFFVKAFANGSSEMVTSLAVTVKMIALNIILMDLAEREQERCYEEYWIPIERNTLGQVSDFARYYLAAKIG